MSKVKKDFYSNKDIVKSYDYKRFKRGGGSLVAQWETDAVDKLLKQTQATEAISVDLPTGTGRFIPVLRSYSKKITAADISPAMIEAAKNYKADEYFICGADSTSFEANSVDLWLMSRFCFHFEDPQPFLNEANRVLKNGGYLIADFNHWTPRALLPNWLLGGKVYNHPKKIVTQLASKCGFEVTKNIPLFFIPSYVYGFLPSSLIKMIEKISDILLPNLKTKSYYLLRKNKDVTQ